MKIVKQSRVTNHLMDSILEKLGILFHCFFSAYCGRFANGPFPRYDARLLLDPGALSSLATKDQPPAAIPSSPTGWSDLPSDAEDTFFLTAEETEDYRREKRRKLLDQNREERLKGRMEEDGEEMWGESDEEPEESQKEIMRRTAKSLLSSPNPAQLEIRILANHGADARFAFLRGRWGRAWKTIKAHARADKLEEDQKVAAKTNPVGIGLVADYGDSDESGEGGEANEKDEESVGTSEPSKAKVEVEAARRERAREWIANRKLAAST
ncbi:hypothetical protein GYMLUDRAFT_32536 [Collybiopsis luxurians FD-317 M1]|nr:hypothetical protein GYMLUDRAFT_32536 [Collybiopsis luxurians FD-317 M1]